jgi:DNA polymerase I
LIVYDHPLGKIKVPGPDDNLDPLYRLQLRSSIWAADTETTGLDIYSGDFTVRIVQVGTIDEAWILNPQFPRHVSAIRALTGGNGKKTHWHNWVYDALSMEETELLGIHIDDTYGAVEDTDIMSRLVDPRPPMKGGVGHKLKDLGDRFVMPGVKDARGEVLAECKRLFGRECNKDNMWKKIPVDNKVYLIYAGQDVFLTARLAIKLRERMEAKGLNSFYAFEKPLSRRLAEMQRIGIAFDDTWASKSEAEYDNLFVENERWLTEDFGLDKRTATHAHSSANALKDAFRELGVEFVKKTKGGADSLDKAVIAELVQHKNTAVRELASAVQGAKRNKHYGDYIRGMRARVGSDGRIHPNIRPMQAATHRMSISDPPIQQFPRGDARVRGCLIADEGEVIITADYAQVEFRVAAAAAQDPVMMARIKNGEDLHRVTAEALFGPDFNKDQRQAAKPIGFGRVYLGGAPGIWQQMVESDTTGYVPTITQIKKAIRAFDKDYRVYVKWAYRLKDMVEESNGRMVTATGRKLIVSPSYAAPNYYIQSTARDLFATGINEAWKRGVGQYIRLVVHDEIVVASPKSEAKEVMRELQEAMTTNFRGVPIETEAEIKGVRWAK